MNNPITFLLAGEFPADQTPLRAVLAAEERYQVLGNITLVASLLAASKALSPQVIIVEWWLKGGNLLDELVAINGRNRPPRIILFVKHPTDLSLFETVRCGALGCLVMDEDEQQIQKTIEAVVRGELALSPQLTRSLSHYLRHFNQSPPGDMRLTDMEIEMLNLIACGYSNLEISQTLAINERTVRTHISMILSKLHLANRTQLALWGLKEGALETGKWSRHFQRVREVCHNLGGTLEGTLHGEPAFFVGGKVYAVYLEVAYPNRPFVLLLPMPYSTQESLLEQSPHKFFRPPRYANDGWIATDLTQFHGDELRYYLYQSWKLVAS